MPAEDVAARGITSMPATLADAVTELAADEVLRRALGQVPGGDYIDYFAKVKAAEFAEYHRVVSDWEVTRYLTLY